MCTFKYTYTLIDYNLVNLEIKENVPLMLHFEEKKLCYKKYF